ncbi:DUF4870 domain-containing protein [Cellulomonas shaoxiangyii]|uniref:DUF4870 domain-containing protein n=1 Tax=Cellulomonas shaoxiangyii TaxID=2566013 RepID=UPI001AA022EA|nr:DUF4870 domain-containing protein [Cellulomonas shaoxiangyii]
MSAYPPPPVAPPLRPDEERTWAVLAHVLPLVVSFVGPLVVWLVCRGRGPFVEHHAKESLNFQLTVLGATMVSFVLMVASFGLLTLLPFGVLVVGAVLHVLGAVAASRGEWYRYPVSVRLIS